MIVPSCRICFEETDSSDNPLLYPCRCDGTSKYVHLNCLNEWRFSNTEFNSMEKRIKCMECKFNYVIEETPKTINCCTLLHLLIYSKWINISPLVIFIINVIFVNVFCDLQTKIDSTIGLQINKNYFSCFMLVPFFFICLYTCIFCYYYCICTKTMNPCFFLFFISFMFSFSNFLLVMLGPIGIVVDTIFYNLFLNHLCYHEIERFLQPSQTIKNYSIENDLSLPQRTYHPPEIERTNTNSFLISSDDTTSLNISTVTDDSDITDSDNYIISSTDSEYESDEEIIIITTNNNILHE